MSLKDKIERTINILRSTPKNHGELIDGASFFAIKKPAPNLQSVFKPAPDISTVEVIELIDQVIGGVLDDPCLPETARSYTCYKLNKLKVEVTNKSLASFDDMVAALSNPNK